VAGSRRPLRHTCQVLSGSRLPRSRAVPFCPREWSRFARCHIPPVICAHGSSCAQLSEAIQAPLDNRLPQTKLFRSQFPAIVASLRCLPSLQVATISLHQHSLGPQHPRTSCSVKTGSRPTSSTQTAVVQNRRQSISGPGWWVQPRRPGIR